MEYLYRFLTANKGAGPYASETDAGGRAAGRRGSARAQGRGCSHTALIVAVRDGEHYVAAHTLDSWMRPLSDYRQPVRRFLHILGVRGGR